MTCHEIGAFPIFDLCLNGFHQAYFGKIAGFFHKDLTFWDHEHQNEKTIVISVVITIITTNLNITKFINPIDPK